jgi:hypothetical protein
MSPRDPNDDRSPSLQGPLRADEILDLSQETTWPDSGEESGWVMLDGADPLTGDEQPKDEGDEPL